MYRKLQNEELNRISTEEFKQAAKLPVVIILDNIRSQNNVGSVFRTSDAFRIEKVYLCGINSTPENREVHKTALGAEDAVEWEYVKETRDVVEKLKTEGYRIFSIEQAENTTSLEDLSIGLDGKYALVFGNEVKAYNRTLSTVPTPVWKFPNSAPNIRSIFRSPSASSYGRSSVPCSLP